MTWQNNTIIDMASDVANLYDKNVHHRYDNVASHMANDVVKIL
jgi:hypothetical protein